ncbi:hypothetical protein KKF32_02655 [Patescibacteria group bacterium]|nr:hypothetical protein [Patescibacteria group bacterium]
MSFKTKKNKIIQDIFWGVSQTYYKFKKIQYYQFFPRFIIIMIVGLAVFAFLFFNLKTKAEVAYFYPSTCLGNWLNPDQAIGKPNLDFVADSSQFNESNSAIFDGGEKQIFCSGFQGEIPEDSEINQIKLNLVWALSQKNEIIDQDSTGNIIEKNIRIIPQQSSISSDDGQSKEDEVDQEKDDEDFSDFSKEDKEEKDSEQDAGDILPSDSSDNNQSGEIEDEQEEAENNEQDTKEQEQTPTSFLPRFINLVLAQESTEQTTTTTEPVLEEDSDIEMGEQDTDSQGEEDQQDLDIEKQEEDSETGEVSTSSKEIFPEVFEEDKISQGWQEPNLAVLEPIFIDSSFENDTKDKILKEEEDKENIFEIKYSLDGALWQSLIFVNKYNFKDDIYLPFYSIEDLTKVQISIESQAIKDKNILVFLDGLALEVEYEVEELLQPEIEQQVPPPAISGVYEDIFPFLVEGDWQRLENALNRDLPLSGSWERFSFEDSAYLEENFEIDLEEEKEEDSLDEIVLNFQEQQVNKNSFAGRTYKKLSKDYKGSMVFWNFTSPNVNKNFYGAYLQLSLAAKNNNFGEKIIIDYSLDDGANWQRVARIPILGEISNQQNGHYWSYPLRMLNFWNDLKRLRIKVSYKNSARPYTQQNVLVFFDNLWLKILRSY